MVALAGEWRDWLLDAVAAAKVRTTSLDGLRTADSARLQSAAILFLPERDSSGKSVLSLVREIRAQHPGLIISICTAHPARVPWRELARAGADDVTVLGGEANAAVLAVWIDKRLTLPVPEEALRELIEKRGCGLAATIAAWCLRNAIRDLEVTAIAEWFVLSQSTLRRRLADASLPQPGKLLRSGRMLHALELELLGVKSKARIATMLGFSTAKELWRAKSTLRTEAQHDSSLANLITDVNDLLRLFLGARREAVGRDP